MAQNSIDLAQKSVNPREVYGKKLVELGRANPDIVVICADVALSNKLHYFGEAFPARFFNVGIAEQNMMGIAAGFALDGKIPFVSTFAAFASMRVCEQVRTDICYVGLPVKIIATCSGVAGGAMGCTHDALEDVALMRNMPNMTVIVPGDPLMSGQFFEQAAELPGPVYLRFGRGNYPAFYDAGVKVEIGKAITAAEGTDATLIASGVTVYMALEASRRLRREGMRVRVLDMHTIKPLDREAVIKAADETGIIVTAEDHFVNGGLGTAVAEILADAGKAVRFRRLGIPDLFPIIGPGEELYHYYGFDADGMENELRRLIREA